VSVQIRFDCPKDRCVAIIEYGPMEECDGVIRCPRCKADIPMTMTESMRDAGTPDRCAVCGCREMFIRKDFPQKIGLAVVVIAGISSIVLFRSNVLLAWAVLASAVLIDLVFYIATGLVTTCYACRAEYRGGKMNASHDGFDLATSEKY
jgi:hypothetical protein